MRAVADSNVVISGLLWRGPSRAVLDAAREARLELFASPELLAEVAEVLERPKFHSRLQQAGVDACEVVAGFTSLAAPEYRAPRGGSSPRGSLARATLSGS